MYGTQDVFSTLAAQAGSQTVAKFGEDRVFAELQRAFNIHNGITRRLIGATVEFTTDRLQRYGGDSTGEMQRLDEYGTPDAQKRITGVNIGLPLDNWGYGIQWTRKFLLNAKVTDITKEAVAAQSAHIRRIQREVLRAWFKATNDLTYEDVLVDKVVLPVRALLNADGSPVPTNPYNGASFNGSTHSHYLFGTAISDSLMDSLITTVQEHGVVGTLVVEIPQLMEASVRALTGFTPQIQANITLGGGSTATVATGNLEVVNKAERKIGVYGAAEVWVRPWAMATSATTGWISCRDTGVPFLGYRHREGVQPVNLNVDYESENYPLRARALSDEFGVGVLRREKAAVLYIAPGAVAYVSPTIS